LDYDGELLWTFGTEFEQWATPSIEGNTLYLPSMDHVIYALDAQSGDLLWTSEDLAGALAGTPPFEEQSALYIGTLNSEMVALNNQDGEILWRIPTEGWVWSGPALEKEVLYFGDMTGTFYSIDAKSGSNIWQPYKLDSEKKQGITGTPLVTEDTIYYGSESGVFTALNSDGGSLRWSKTIEGKLFQGPVAADDLILVAPADSDPVLIAMDYDGNQKWAFVPQK
jgi:outer membrane protein assembly factor BamB